MLSNQVSKMLHLELLHIVMLQTFFGAGFYLFHRALIYHTYLSSLLSTILILSFKRRFFSGMENHVFLPIISAFCLPEQERIDVNCLETLMDLPSLPSPSSAADKSTSSGPGSQMSPTQRVCGLKAWSGSWHWNSPTQIHKLSIISTRRTSQI